MCIQIPILLIRSPWILHLYNFTLRNFTKLAELAREANEDKWESKVDKYVNDGLTEEEARLKPNRKLNGVDLD